ncbi:patatin-like phospholipase family protein [Ruminiclostridium josui]|uniref:patatin-like phospholipase family protein n=1 Tax=Ruminiclostridium josui TaxID=1499 RepID=UPI0004659E48|nr:patatin family protein [Ruminiclostridium josui]
MARVNLILEGGGMRGLYTAGVLDFFLDHKMFFKDIVGVSAGACNSVSYITGQRGRNLEINAGYCNDNRYVSIMGLFTRGSIFNMDFLFDDIPNKLIPFDYDKFKNSDCKLTVVSTDCETGKSYYSLVKDMRVDDVYVRASSSIPLLSPIVEVDGRKLVDGGPSDSIPIQYSVNNGFDKHVIVLTRHKGYEKKPNRLYPLCKLKLKNYPNLSEAIKNRHIHYNESIKLAEKLEKENKAVIIRPKKPVKISRFERNPENLKKLYAEGYKDAEEKYSELIHLCRECSNFSSL